MSGAKLMAAKAQKLTGPQIAVLRKLAKPGEYAALCIEDHGDAWAINSSGELCTRQISRLLALGLAWWHVQEYYYTTISDAGRAALAQIDAERGQG